MNDFKNEVNENNISSHSNTHSDHNNNTMHTIRNLNLTNASGPSHKNNINDAWEDLKVAPRELYVIFLLKFLESYSYFAIIYTLIIFL